MSTIVLKGGKGLIDVGSENGSAAKGLTIDMELSGSGLLAAVFAFPSLSLPCVVLYLIFHWHCHGT